MSSHDRGLHAQMAAFNNKLSKLEGCIAFIIDTETEQVRKGDMEALGRQAVALLALIN